MDRPTQSSENMRSRCVMEVLIFSGSLFATTAEQLAAKHRVKLWSFESKRFHRETAPKFLVVIVLGIIINSTAIHIFVTFGLHFLIAQVFAMSVVIIWNFGMFKWWVFPQNSSAP